MKRILIILLTSLPFLELSAQDRNEPFTDFLSWKETYLFEMHAVDTLVLSRKPGNEVYFLSLEGPRFLMEADMDALNEDIPGQIVPQYARQWFHPDKDENAKNYIYEWESPILAIERDFTGPIPEDIKEYPFRKNGNGKGVWDLLMVAARLRRGSDLNDLISSTVMFCGKQHYISAIRTALVFVGDEKATQYTVYFDQKTHVKATYESKGYHRPLAFDLRFGDMKIKGKLIEQQ